MSNALPPDYNDKPVTAAYLNASTELKQLKADRADPNSAASVVKGLLTPAQQRLMELKLAVSKLPQNEQNEFDFVSERLRFFMARHQSSAALAIVAMSLEIAIHEGQ
jgi:hypothetical protein